MNDNDRMTRVENFFRAFLDGLVQKGVYLSARSGIGLRELGSPDFIAHTKHQDVIAFTIRFRQGVRPESDKRTDSLAVRFPNMRVLHVEDIEAKMLDARTDGGAGLLKLINESDVVVFSGGRFRIGNLLKETAGLSGIAEKVVVGAMSSTIAGLIVAFVTGSIH